METLDKPSDGVASFLLYGKQGAEQASFGPPGLQKQIQARLESEGFGRCWRLVLAKDSHVFIVIF